MFCFGRDTYLLRTSSRFLAWPWSSLTAWLSGRKTTWRRRHAFSRQKKNISTSIRPVWEEAEKKSDPFEIYSICSTMIPLLATCKTSCHLPVMPRRGAPLGNIFRILRQHLKLFVCNVVRMSDWQPYRRGRGAAFAWPVLMLLSSHGVSASSPAHLDAFIHPGKIIITQILMQAFPWVSVVLTVLCAPSSIPSNWLISLVSIAGFSSAVYLCISSVCCSSLFLSLSLHHFKFFSLHWLLHYQASSFLHLCHYFSDSEELQICTHSLFKHVQAKDGDKKQL